MRCDECRFFDPWENEVKLFDGACRRHPPSRDNWPDVRGDDWCGEFEAKVPMNTDFLNKPAGQMKLPDGIKTFSEAEAWVAKWAPQLMKVEPTAPDLGRRKLDQDMHCEFGE